jgi:formate/nitrite transporter FocA (FNT family)
MPQQENEKSTQTSQGDNADERAEISQRQSPSGSIVFKAVCQEGSDELERPSSALSWSGLAAGMSMGFSMLTEGLLRNSLPASSWSPLVYKFGYSMGFLIVVLGRQQLFTENTLTVILPLTSRRDIKTFWNVMRLWIVVLSSNLLGAFIFAIVAARTSVFAADLRDAFHAMGAEAMLPAFGTMLLRATFAGWLIALMVWLLPFAEAFRVIVIILLTYVIALAHFSHSIAGGVDTLYLVCCGDLPASRWFTAFLAPTLMGNILGGVMLVALINSAQMMAGAQGRDA